jgi:hypothetical protein
MHEIRRKIVGQPGQYWPLWMLGESMALQKRDSEAVTLINSALALPVPRDASGQMPVAMRAMRLQALETLATVYERNNQAERAAAIREQIQAAK